LATLFRISLNSRRTKLDYDVKEAVDVVVFEDNLESNNPILKLLKTLLFALFFCGSVLPKENHYTQFEVTPSPEILKRRS
jgi:hypothetical protein